MLLVLGSFFLLLFLGLPIGYVLGVAGLLGLVSVGGSDFLAMAPQRYYAGLDQFTFLAMPFFILAGEIMNRSGITRRLVEFADALVGWLRGGMAHSTIVASTLFAGITGAAVAEAAAFGNTMVPAMVQAGYKKNYACAVVVAGSIIGPTIPPSNLMVIYGSMMGVSIAGLFAAGLLPGILMGLICMAVIAAMGKRLGLPKSKDRPSLIRLFRAFKSGLVALMMPVIILGGILGGLVTPTEGAAIAVAYALFIGAFVYREITWADLLDMLIRTARVTGVVFLIIATASILSWWMTFEHLPQLITAAFLSVSHDPTAIIAMVVVLLLILGMLMDINAILIILGPVLAPLLTSIGVDPVHAGILIVLALNIGLMTPPVGASLFVLCSIANESLESVSMAMWPFMLGEIIILLLIAFWPQMTMFVPHLLGF